VYFSHGAARDGKGTLSTFGTAVDDSVPTRWSFAITAGGWRLYKLRPLKNGFGECERSFGEFKFDEAG
jgi:hypothetical protein